VKYFLDQGVPRRAAELLRQEGIDVVHAGEVGLSAADDEPLRAKHSIRWPLPKPGVFASSGMWVRRKPRPSELSCVTSKA
jgi:hypothetical protein